jgi:chaperonin cofactor prefoldin
MESNELLEVIERGFNELRTESVQQISSVRADIGRLDDRIGRLDDRIHQVQMLTEDIRGEIRHMAEGYGWTTTKLEEHLAEGGAPLEERVSTLEVRVDVLDKKRRRN